jgi:hypothetical protein
LWTIQQKVAMKKFESVEEFVGLYCPGLKFTVEKSDPDSFFEGWIVRANGRQFRIAKDMLWRWEGDIYEDAHNEMVAIMRDELNWPRGIIPTMTNTKKRIFARNPNSGEPAYYCGEAKDSHDLRSAIADIVLGELDNILCGGSDQETIEFEVKEMTDEEVDALPDI